MTSEGKNNSPSAHNLRSSLVQSKTETKKAENIFQLLVESVKDYAIFLLDENGIIESWNEGARRNKGYTAEEIIGRHFSIFYTPEDLARSHPAKELEIAKKTGRYEEEGWRVRKDGSHFWANVVITALRDKNGHLIGFAKVTRDLSERKKSEEKLRTALEQTEKRVQERTQELMEMNLKLQEAVQVRDEFLSIASHELRTPLTPLKLQIDGLVRQVKNKTFFSLSEERILRLAKTSERAITRLSVLIDNLLDISRINSGRLQLNYEEVDLVSVVREVMERHESDIAAAGAIIEFKAPDVLSGAVDRIRFEQVITNLLSNALKFGKGKPIEISLSKTSDRVLIGFKDKGIGISSKDQMRIFERFERVLSSENIGGLGLGLYISQQIVHAHGGSIRLESVEGQGSKFIVELPSERV